MIDDRDVEVAKAVAEVWKPDLTLPFAGPSLDPSTPATQVTTHMRKHNSNVICSSDLFAMAIVPTLLPPRTAASLAALGVRIGDILEAAQAAFKAEDGRELNTEQAILMLDREIGMSESPSMWEQPLRTETIRGSDENGNPDVTELSITFERLQGSAPTEQGVRRGRDERVGQRPLIGRSRAGSRRHGRHRSIDFTLSTARSGGSSDAGPSVPRGRRWPSRRPDRPRGDGPPSLLSPGPAATCCRTFPEFLNRRSQTWRPQPDPVRSPAKPSSPRRRDPGAHPRGAGCQPWASKAICGGRPAAALRRP